MAAKSGDAPNTVPKTVMTEGKRRIVREILAEYDVKTAGDVQDALKDLLGAAIREMMEAEMDEFLRSGAVPGDSRNGRKEKTVTSLWGPLRIDVPQDRAGAFEPRAVEKRQRDVSGIDRKIVAMYARGLTTRQISGLVRDVWGFDVSEGFVSDVTDKILPELAAWRSRPLDPVWPVIYAGEARYYVREGGAIRGSAARLFLGVNRAGKKEVLTVDAGGGDDPGYWRAALGSLRDRGVRDVLVFCADAFPGLREAAREIFPRADVLRCAARLVRDTLRRVSEADRGPLAADLGAICAAPDEERGRAARAAAAAKWADKYPRALRPWEKDWDALAPAFKFTPGVRSLIGTTGAVESLNAACRRLNRLRTVFPGEKALLKALYLAALDASRKWTRPVRNWRAARAELAAAYGDRFPGEPREGPRFTEKTSHT